MSHQESHDDRSAGFTRRNLLIAGATAAIGSPFLGDLITAPVAQAAAGDLTSGSFNLFIDPSTGGVTRFINPTDRLGTNFVIGPADRSQFNVNDSRWTGDLIFNVRRASSATGTTMVSGLSDDSRTVTQTASSVSVSYSGNAANPNGIRGFRVDEAFTLTGSGGDQLSWTVTVTNTSSEALEFQDFGFPLLMNSYWYGGDQTAIYEKNVGRHSFVAKDGSFIYWQRPNGIGPYLLMTAQPGTSLEFKNKARYNEGPFAEVDPYWEGLVEFYVHSKNVSAQRANEAAQYLSATSSTVLPGASRTFGFTFKWANDYVGLRDAIYTSGLLDVVSMPGMVIPQDMQATLALRAQGGVNSVAGESGRGVTVTSLGTRNGYSLYSLSFANIGPSTVTVSYAGGQQSVLQYNSIRSIESVISARSNFLVTKQQARTSRGYNGAFLQWDMSRQILLTWDNYPGGGWKQWMAGGSDDLGLAPAEFITEKCLVSPVQAEVSAVDFYITNFLLGYLQSRTENGVRTWQVYRWFDGRDGSPSDQGVWRAYNYTHIANTYFNMYRLRKTYPSLTMSRPAAEYLEMTFQTLNAMYSKIPLPTPIGDAAHHLGLMGESTYPDILAALEAEGQVTKASQLRAHIESKRDYLFSQAYPFASEASIDTTGFEANYTIAKMYGNRALMDNVEAASQASRGIQPIWYFYGSDNRHMGESWWNLGYETQLGAWQQQDYLLSFTSQNDRDFHEIMRQTYGAYLAGWSNINSGQISSAAGNLGAASWQYQSEKGTNNYDWIPSLGGWWAWSGEADLGFWGGVRAASVNVVEDRIVGTYAYGGDLTISTDTYTVVPKDGVRTRLAFYNLNKLNIELQGARYSRAVVSRTLTSFVLSIENPLSGAYTPRIFLRNLPAGSYRVTVDGTSTTQTVTSSAAATGFSVSLNGSSHTVRVTRI